MFSDLTLYNIINILITLLMFLGIVVGLHQIKGISKDRIFFIFYITYFTIFGFVLFLPLPLPLTKPDINFALHSIQWNALYFITEHFKKVSTSIQNLNIIPLINFIMNYIGRIIIAMPLADFIYSIFTTWNRRKCFAVISILLAIVEFVQIFLNFITGHNYIVVGTTPYFCYLIGVLIFYSITYLVDSDFFTNKSK